MTDMSPARERLIELFGWYGTAAVILGYALVSFSVLEATSVWFQLLNGTGALGIILVSLRKRAFQPAVLNIIWALIALASILRITF